MSFHLRYTIIIIVVAIIVLILCYFWDNVFPHKSTYQEVQEFRNKQDYYISDGNDYVDDWYGPDTTTFSYDDMVDAYNHGLNHGIEQTIEYYESLED